MDPRLIRSDKAATRPSPSPRAAITFWSSEASSASARQCPNACTLMNQALQGRYHSPAWRCHPSPWQKRNLIFQGPARTDSDPIRTMRECSDARKKSVYADLRIFTHFYAFLRFFTRFYASLHSTEKLMSNTAERGAACQNEPNTPLVNQNFSAQAMQT